MARSSLFSASGKLYTDLKAFCSERRKERGKCRTLRELNKAVALTKVQRQGFVAYSLKHHHLTEGDKPLKT